MLISSNKIANFDSILDNPSRQGVAPNQQEDDPVDHTEEPIVSHGSFS